MISEAQAQKYCHEDISKIENYEQAVNDKDNQWDCHHRAEILPCGVYSRENLKKVGLYWNRPASELIYIRHDEHMALHTRNRKPETIRRIAEKKMGKPRDLETRRKISESYPRKKKVEMTRRSDGYIREFPSMGEAARWLRENGHPKATITRVSQCATGHRATAYGSTWRRV